MLVEKPTARGRKVVTVESREMGPCPDDSLGDPIGQRTARDTGSRHGFQNEVERPTPEYRLALEIHDRVVWTRLGQNIVKQLGVVAILVAPRLRASREIPDVEHRDEGQGADEPQR